MSTSHRRRNRASSQGANGDARKDDALDLIADGNEIVEKTIAHLRVRFGITYSRSEREDLAHEAYVRLLEYRDRGGEIRAPLAAVKRSAVNLGFDQANRERREPAEDPMSDRFLSEVAGGAPDGIVAGRIALARAIDAASTLPPEQQAVYRALVIDELTPAKARRRLGMAPSTFFKYRKRAFDWVTDALLADQDSEAGRERTRLLTAYEYGTCTDAERARVRRLLKADPSVRPQLVSIREGHRAVAISLPALALHGDNAEATAGVLERLAAATGRVRDALAGPLQRGGAEVGETTAAIATSGAGRGAGAVGAGLLAKFGALGGGTQAAIACLAGGAVVTTCVATGILSGSNPSSGDGERERPRAERAGEPRPAPAAAGVVPTQVGDSEPAPAPQPPDRERDSSGEEDAEASARPEPVLEESAPAVQQEFTPDSAGVPVSGAAADTNDSNGASAGTVREEFGP